MSSISGISVYIEISNGSIVPVCMESLGLGRKLADETGEQLTAILCGSNVTVHTQTVITLGADIVIIVENKNLATYENDAYVQALEQVINTLKPRLLIFGQTDNTRDLAPRLAFLFGTNAILDCVNCEFDKTTDTLYATKPVYGGNVLAVYACNTDTQIVTIRSKTMEIPEPDMTRKGESINIDVELSDVRTTTVDYVIEKTEGIKLDDAEVVVAGGRGIGSEQGFEQLLSLANLFDGAVGATRPPCDNKWITDTAQVGLTGKIITPQLYIAVAISGSSQHLSGCSGSKVIVAINKDKEANIFRHAHLGAVGDWKEILPAFIEKIKDVKC